MTRKRTGTALVLLLTVAGLVGALLGPRWGGPQPLDAGRSAGQTAAPSRPGAEALGAGFHLVGWLGETIDIASAVAPLGPALEALYLWDAASQSFLVYAPSLPPALNTATTLDRGDGVWLQLNQEAAWPAGAVSCATPPSEAGSEEFEDAEVLIEFNAADGDVGFHGTFDSPGWSEALICAPDGSELVRVEAGGATQAFGLSQLFFEGAEPPLEEQPLDEFLGRFAEGDYLVVGRLVDGTLLRSASEFTHEIPDPPLMLSPADEAELTSDAVLLSWEPVTGVELDSYEVSVAALGPAAGDGDPSLDLDLFVVLPPETTSFQVPAALLAPGTRYEFEVLSVEASGNKTIAAGEFVVVAE